MKPLRLASYGCLVIAVYFFMSYVNSFQGKGTDVFYMPAPPFYGGVILSVVFFIAFLVLWRKSK